MEKLKKQKTSMSETKSTLNNSVLIGTIVMHGGNFDFKTKEEQDQWEAKHGWMICDGRELDNENKVYTSLFAHIDKAFGGSANKFNIPDCRGMFIRGVDKGRCKDPNREQRKPSNVGGNVGNNVGSVQDDSFKKHSHFCGDDHKTNYQEKSHKYKDRPIIKGSGSKHTPSLEMGGDETRPVNLYLNFIIKFKDVQ